MSLQLRITTVNVFVTPIFSYLYQFFIIPQDIHATYRTAVSRAVTPYHGSGWDYAHLAVPPQLMGPHTPIADLWICTAMRQLWPRIRDTTRENAPWGFNTGRAPGIYFFTPRIAAQRDLFLMEIIGPLYLDLASDPPPKLNELSKAQFKLTLIKNNLHQWKGNPARHRESNYIYGGHNRQILLHERFLKYGDGSFKQTLAHFTHFNRATTPAHLISHHIKCFTNALPTHHRLWKANINTISTLPYASPNRIFPCYLCRHGYDKIDHIMSLNCSGLSNALTILGGEGFFSSEHLSELRHSLASGNPSFHFNFNIDPKAPSKRLNAMLHLNWATWAARRRIMGAGGYLEDAAPGKLIASLTNSSHTLYNTPRTAKQRKKRNLASFLSLLHW